MDPITRDDLEKALDKQSAEIKEHLDLKVEPLQKEIDGHSRTLYGKSGGNGLSGSVKVLKWGYGLIAATLIFVAKELFL